MPRPITLEELLGLRGQPDVPPIVGRGGESLADVAARTDRGDGTTRRYTNSDLAPRNKETGAVLPVTFDPPSSYQAQPGDPDYGWQTREDPVAGAKGFLKDNPVDRRYELPNEPSMGEVRSVNGETREWTGRGWARTDKPGPPRAMTPLADQNETDDPNIARLRGFFQGAGEAATPGKLGTIGALTGGPMGAMAGTALGEGVQWAVGGPDAPESAVEAIGQPLLAGALTAAPGLAMKGIRALPSVSKATMGLAERLPYIGKPLRTFNSIRALGKSMGGEVDDIAAGALRPSAPAGAPVGAPASEGASPHMKWFQGREVPYRGPSGPSGAFSEVGEAEMAAGTPRPVPRPVTPAEPVFSDVRPQLDQAAALDDEIAFAQRETAARPPNLSQNRLGTLDNARDVQRGGVQVMDDAARVKQFRMSEAEKGAVARDKLRGTKADTSHSAAARELERARTSPSIRALQQAMAPQPAAPPTQWTAGDEESILDALRRALASRTTPR